jgi:LuxR family maltose regulon positive regulatory protein
VAADAPATAAVRDGVVSRPGLFRRLTEAHRVVQVSAPPGSGKTVLLRSWIAESGLAECSAWVSVPAEERDPQRLWISVTDALRETAVGSALVHGLTAAPGLDGWTAVERLLEDLASMRERVWLVIDDLHELCSAEALRQLELLIMRAPPRLRFILVTRHDLRLGLHRLRLAGELTEIRTADLRFSPAEARALLDAAGVPLPDSSLAALCTTGPRAGPPGCGWRRCRWPGTPIRSDSRPSSAAANARSLSTCWLRSWSGRAKRPGSCCCGPPSWPGSTVSWPTC